MNDLSILAGADAWRHWGFEPWTHDDMAGVRRRVTFTKRGLLGEVARYYGDDYIVWTHGGETDCRRVYETWRPLPDVMLHRFVFVVEQATRPVRKRSYLFGLRGYLEVYQYAFDTESPRRIRDLTPLVNQARKLTRENTGR